MPIWKALEMYSQADRSDRHSIGTTFAEVTEWHLVKKLGGRWCNDLFILVLRFFFSCCILGKSVILHKRRNFIKLEERIQTNSVNSKKDSMSKRENSTTQIGAPKFQVF